MGRVRPGIIFGGVLAVTLVFLSVGIGRAWVLPMRNSSLQGYLVSHGWRSYLALALGNIIPEQFVVRFGLDELLRKFDSSMSVQRQSIVEAAIGEIYDELKASDDFANAPSTFGFSLLDLLFLGSPSIEYIAAYKPPHLSESGKEVIFFHGAIGSTKAYLWCLKQISDATGTVIFAPSLGFGRWQSWSSTNELTDVIEERSQITMSNTKRTYLIGLSSGAIGALKAAPRIKNLGGIVLISPALGGVDEIEQDLLSIDSRVPLVIYSGLEDHNTPIDLVTEGVKRLKKHFSNIQLKIFSQEDHFLIFTQREKIAREIRLLIGDKERQ